MISRIANHRSANASASWDHRHPGAELAIDEAEFCDASTVVTFLTEEHPVINADR
jgi:hypothetical protein